MRNMLVLLIAAAVVMSVSGTVVGQGVTAAVKSVTLEGNAIVDNLKRAQPGIPIDRVESTPMPGMYAVVLKDGTVLYGSKNGKHLFSGDMFDISGGEIVNLAEQRRTKSRQSLLTDPLMGEGLVFAATGMRKATISVFTDVDCGFCRKLHLEVPQLNAMGVEVRYLAYPRAGVGSESYKKIVSAWCSKDPNTALTALKAGKTIADNQCNDNPVADLYQLGQRMGISGTPAILLEDGRLLPGYMPAAQLAETIGI